MKAVRIKYLVDSNWILTGLIPTKKAEKYLHLYNKGIIVDNGEDY